jgi:imidazolonepropionase-like amidohydrolase
MTTMEALVAATSINARILKLDRLGTVAARKEASLVVLDANPLDDILNTRRIASVYLRGEEVDRKKLRAGFQQAPSSK